MMQLLQMRDSLIAIFHSINKPKFSFYKVKSLSADMWSPIWKAVLTNREVKVYNN